MEDKTIKVEEIQEVIEVEKIDEEASKGDE